MLPTIIREPMWIDCEQLYNPQKQKCCSYKLHHQTSIDIQWKGDFSSILLKVNDNKMEILLLFSETKEELHELIWDCKRCSYVIRVS